MIRLLKSATRAPHILFALGLQEPRDNSRMFVWASFLMLWSKSPQSLRSAAQQHRTSGYFANSTCLAYPVEVIMSTNRHGKKPNEGTSSLGKISRNREWNDEPGAAKNKNPILDLKMGSAARQQIDTNWCELPASWRKKKQAFGTIHWNRRMDCTKDQG